MSSPIEGRGQVELDSAALPTDSMGLLEGLVSTRAIRRYTDDPIPPETLRAILFAATRAPSGSNRQPFRFVVLSDGPKALQAKALIGNAAREMWSAKRARDGYDRGSGQTKDSPKARFAASMESYVENFERAPVVVLPCLILYRALTPSTGGSIYPAVQNLLLAARATGYGGVITGFHEAVQADLKALLGIPEEVFIASTVTLGKPQGRHGSVRRRPLRDLVFEDAWEAPAEWAVDPPGTRYTSAGPPKKSRPQSS